MGTTRTMSFVVILKRILHWYEFIINIYLPFQSLGFTVSKFERDFIMLEEISVYKDDVAL